MGRKILALDLKEDAVSAILISSSLRGNSIEAHLQVPVNEQASSFRDALQLIAQQIRIDGATCVVSIPAVDVAFRNMTIPFSSPKKIKQILPFELETSLPFPVEDLVIDFLPVKRSESGIGTDILVGCVNKDRLSECLSTLSEFNLHPDMLTVSGLPVAHCLCRQDNFPEDGLIMDMGSDTITLFVIVSQQIQLVRVLPSRQPGPDGLLLLSQRIRYTLFAVEDMLQRNLEIKALIFTGTGSEDDELVNELSRSLGVSARFANLAEDLDFRFKKESGSLLNPSTMDNPLALGQMELEGSSVLNFQKRSFLEKRFWSEHGKRIIQSGALAVLVLLAAFLHILFDTYALQQQVAKSDRKIKAVLQNTFPDVKRVVDPLHQMRVKINSAKAATLSSGENHYRHRTIDVLNHISKQIPQNINIEITRLVIGPETTLISGNTDTFNTVDDIKNRLEAATIFKTVTISSANMDRSENSVRFKIKIDLGDQETKEN